MATVPAETVSLTMRADSLLKLPEGAVYTARRGRVSVEVRKGRTAGTLEVRASCDSLQRQVEEYVRRTLRSSADSTGTKETSETRESRRQGMGRPKGWTCWAVVAAVAAMGAMAWLTRKRHDEKTS